MKTRFNLLIPALAALLLASCSTPANIGYLRDLEYGVDYEAAKAPALKLQSEDILAIRVLSSDPALAAPFNSWTGGSTAAEDISTRYVVDSDGDIVFPVLGTLHAEGKNIDDLKDEIAGQISSLGYIKEPIVKVRLVNFSVTVIGEVNTILTVDGESMNLLQAVARMNIPRESSKIRDLMVIRTEDGVRRAYPVNLQSKDLYDSPVYYLQQNDVIYVKPKGIRFSITGSTIRDFFGTIFSSITSIFYASYWLNR